MQLTQEQLQEWNEILKEEHARKRQAIIDRFKTAHHAFLDTGKIYGADIPFIMQGLGIWQGLPSATKGGLQKYTYVENMPDSLRYSKQSKKGTAKMTEREQIVLQELFRGLLAIDREGKRIS